MIPYDDLVIALQAWRAKKGLPISQNSGSLVPPQAAAPAPASSPGSGPGRAAPPAPPPPRPPARGGSQMTTDEVEPATEALHALGPDDAHEHVEEHVEHVEHLEHADEHVESAEPAEPVEEHQYQNEGDDFAMAFASLETEGESTAIGQAPAPGRGADATLPRGGRGEDW
jgi:hypothetical protein